MKHFVRALLVLLFLILQSTFCHFIKIMGVMPDLVLAYIIALALTSDSIIYSGAYGLAAGLLWDIMWSRVFGIQSLLFMYIAVLAYRAGEYMYKKDLSVCVVFTLICTIPVKSIFYIAGFVLEYDASFWHAFFRTIIPAAAYTAICQVIIYQICLKVKGIGQERSGV